MNTSTPAIDIARYRLTWTHLARGKSFVETLPADTIMAPEGHNYGGSLRNCNLYMMSLGWTAAIEPA